VGIEIMIENETKELVMNHKIETPMTFDNSGSASSNDWATASLDRSEELDWLMSMALDDALDGPDAERMELLLSQEPQYLERWAAWQAVDSVFHELPMAIPAPDFAQNFARKLEIRERQRRLRTGVIFGTAAVALWISALTGLAIMGALVWSNQNLLVGGLIQDMAYWWSAAGQLGRALLSTGAALWSAPQTRALFVCYVALVIAILSAWFMFLRHSTHELPLAEAQLIEA